jgi:peptide/nickel transport system permease protein
VTAYLVRRLLLLVPTLIVVTLLVSLVVRLLPAKAIEVLAAQQGFSEEAELEELERELGLDKGWPQQYWDWFSGLFRGDMGISLRTRREISAELATRLPVSLELAGMALVMALLVAVPVGVVSAVRRNSLVDYAARSAAIMGVALPGFWLATLIVVWPSVWWGWSPPSRFVPLHKDPLGNLAFMWLPALLLSLYFVGFLMRMTRTMMLEVISSDYVRTARAKGLPGYVVLLRHALRSGLIPVVTVVGLQIPVLIGGAVVYETIFSVPGIGRYLIEAAQNRDYPVIQGINLILAATVLFLNLLVDLSYSFIDPRVRLEGRR